MPGYRNKRVRSNFRLGPRTVEIREQRDGIRRVERGAFPIRPAYECLHLGSGVYRNPCSVGKHRIQHFKAGASCGCRRTRTSGLETLQELDHSAVHRFRPLLLRPVAATRQHDRLLQAGNEFRQVRDQLVHAAERNE
jgi:hypothetical protein